MNFDRRLLRLAWTARSRLIAAVLLGFLTGTAVVLQARLVSRVIAQVFLSGQSLSGVLPLLWLLLGVVIARPVLTFLSEVAAGAAAARLKEHLREAFSAHLAALGPAYTQGERSGELVNTAVQGIESLDAYFSQYLPQLVLAGLLPLAFLLVAFPLDPLSAAILLVTGPLIPFFMFLIGSNAQAFTRHQWTALSRMSAYFLDTLQGLETLKAMGRSREQGSRIAQVSERYRDTTLSVLRITFLSALSLELLGTIGTAIIAVQIGLRLLYGGIAFEQAFFLLLLAPEFYLPLRSLGLRFHASMAGAAAAKRIYQVLESPLPPKAAGVERKVSLRGPFVLQLDRVTYTYPQREMPAVADLSIQVASGEMVALVGPSGAGKSTVAQLVLRFITPQRGTLQVSGTDLEHVSVDDWRAQIAWVPQRPYLFHGTIADNLRISRADASDADLRRALKWAHLDELVRSLANGLDTPLGEGGSRLSGGEAQRLALARAFLRDVPLLVLDEPTAHLDVVLEGMLRDSLARLCRDRTVLVIAHRLATIARADRIYYLERGRLVESGSHAGLSANNGAYARLLTAYGGGT